MDLSALMKLLPVILDAVQVAKDISDTKKSGASVMSILQSKGPAVIELVTKAGADLFPNFSQEAQVQAGATRFDMTLTKQIQSALNARGAHLTVDGQYGPLTKEAVKSYQSANALAPDGWAGPLTQAKLLKAA